MSLAVSKTSMMRWNSNKMTEITTVYHWISNSVPSSRSWAHMRMRSTCRIYPFSVIKPIQNNWPNSSNVSMINYFKRTKRQPLLSRNYSKLNYKLRMLQLIRCTGWKPSYTN
jgi:hypothetical protein